MYTKGKLNKLLRDLKADKNSGEEMGFNDDQAFDIADGILFDEDGLEEYIRTDMGIQDPQGWLANKI